MVGIEWLIIGGVLWIATILISALKDRIRDSLNWLIDFFLNLFSLKIALYKKKTREYFEELENIIEPVEKFRERSPKFIFEGEEKNKEGFDWRIININKQLSKDRIEKSVILQLPNRSLFYHERILMTPQHKEAFFFAISKLLAEKHEKSDVIEKIEEIVQKKDIVKEFRLMYELFKDKNKRFAMIQEARRKWSFVRGKVTETDKKEYEKFLENLKKGLITVITIYEKKEPKIYFFDVQSSLSVRPIVHIYARGTVHLRTLDELTWIIKEWIAKKNLRKKIGLEDLQEYDWLDEKGKIVYKARTVIIEKKG